MATIADLVHREFYHLNNIYHIGLHCSGGGYEDFFDKQYREFLDYFPGVRRVGVTCEKIIAERSSARFDDVIVGDMFNIQYDGLVHLPRPNTWYLPGVLEDFRVMQKLLSKISGGGLMLTHIHEDYINPERRRQWISKMSVWAEVPSKSFNYESQDDIMLMVKNYPLRQPLKSS